MNFTRWMALATFAFGILLLTSGCGRVGLFGGASPTSPPSRTPRPTFTPRSEETATDVPTEVPQDTATDVPTEAPILPTKRPVATAKPKPPTVRPEPTSIPPTAGPTASPYHFLFYPLACAPGADPAGCNTQSGGIECAHSGIHWIDVIVGADYNNPNSGEAGHIVRYSWAPDGGKIVDATTNYEGKATLTLSGAGDPYTKGNGTYYAWLVDSSGNRISDVSPAIVINSKKPDASDTCWEAKLAFAGGH